MQIGSIPRSTWPCSFWRADVRFVYEPGPKQTISRGNVWFVYELATELRHTVPGFSYWSRCRGPTNVTRSPYAASTLDRSRAQPAHELLLQREEQDRWRNDREQRPCQEHAVIVAVEVDVLVEHHRQRQLVLRLQEDAWTEEGVPLPEERDQAKCRAHWPHQGQRERKIDTELAAAVDAS